MSPITTETIKELRDATGISVMQCKKALEESDGDMNKALIILRKKGSEIAGKKGDRNLGAGTVASYVHNTGNVGATVVLLSETDFVAKNAEFKSLAYEIAMQVAATNPGFLTKEDIDEDARKDAREVFKKEVKDKPAEMQGKILEGKLNAYFKEKILLEQSFIKNPEMTIKDLIDGATQKFGERIEIAKFARFNV